MSAASLSAAAAAAAAILRIARTCASSSLLGSTGPAAAAAAASTGLTASPQATLPLLARTRALGLGPPPRTAAAAGVIKTSTPFNHSRAFSAYGDYPSIEYPASEAFVGQPAPEFTTGAVVDNEIKSISLSDYKGKYVVLFFYPKDFTFVCPTEIIAFSDRAKEFEALNCQVIAASTDTEECHLAWIRTPRSRGGLGYMQIPIIADVTKEISALYGVLIQKAGIAHRGLFIINPEGVVEQITINNLSIGRSVDETLRLLQAVQYVAKHGEVCPANWKPGEKTMIADTDKSLEYFASVKESGGDDVFATKLQPVKDAKHYKQLIEAGKPLVLDFYAPWCGKCRQIGPFLDELVDKYPAVTFAKFDTTQENLELLGTELGVKALPAFKFFKGGKEVVEQVVGYKKKPLEEAVAKL